MADDEQTAPLPLPKEMMYSSLLERAAPSERTTRLFQPNNGSTFSSSTASEIRIPITLPHGTFLDSNSIHLNMGVTLSVTAAASAKVCDLDGGIDSVLREISVIGPDGAILSRTSSYNVLSAQMKTLTMDAAAADQSYITQTTGFNRKALLIDLSVAV